MDWTPSWFIKVNTLRGIDNLRIIDYENSYKHSYQTLLETIKLSIPNENTGLK